MKALGELGSPTKAIMVLCPEKWIRMSELLSLHPRDSWGMRTDIPESITGTWKEPHKTMFSVYQKLPCKIQDVNQPPVKLYNKKVNLTFVPSSPLYLVEI